MIQTRKQELFIKSYIRLKNATRAAIEAGYSLKGANRAGSRLLSDVDIKGEIDRQFNDIQEGLEITEGNILKKLWYEACNAQRAADRINAISQVAKIKGLMKDTPQQSIAIFNQLEKELRTLHPVTVTKE